MPELKYFVAGLLLLAGCTNIGFAHSDYEEKLSPWVGKTASALYNYWGYPQQLTAVDSNTMLAVYYSSENQPVDNDFEPYESEMSYAAMAVPDFGVPPPPPLFYCKTTFVIRNNIVTGYNFNGDDCY